ncbi:MAG: hypothetical protein ACRDHY_19315, partial [Anaerolineales bacterium]
EDAKYASWFRAQGRPGGGTPASTGAGAPGQGGRLRVTREQLGDGAYYKEHRDEILKAQREGRLDITG